MRYVGYYVVEPENPLVPKGREVVARAPGIVEEDTTADGKREAAIEFASRIVVDKKTEFIIIPEQHITKVKVKPKKSWEAL